jgi:hypothetical protein
MISNTFALRLLLSVARGSVHRVVDPLHKGRSAGHAGLHEQVAQRRSLGGAMAAQSSRAHVETLGDLGGDLGEYRPW